MTPPMIAATLVVLEEVAPTGPGLTGPVDEGSEWSVVYPAGEPLVVVVIGGNDVFPPGRPGVSVPTWAIVSVRGGRDVSEPVAAPVFLDVSVLVWVPGASTVVLLLGSWGLEEFVVGGVGGPSLGPGPGRCPSWAWPCASRRARVASKIGCNWKQSTSREAQKRNRT